MARTFGCANGTLPFTYLGLPAFVHVCLLHLCHCDQNELTNLLMEGIDARKQPNAASGLVCSPKEEGGLGVIDVKKQNEVVLLKK